MSGKPMDPCMYGSNCRGIDTNCKFNHPGRPTKFAPAVAASPMPAGGSKTPCKYAEKCTRAECTFGHPPNRVQPAEHKRAPNHPPRGPSAKPRTQTGSQPRAKNPSLKQVGSQKIQAFDSNVNAFCVVALTGSEQAQQEALRLLMKEKVSIRGQLTALLELLDVSEKKLDSIIEKSETLKSVSKEVVAPATPTNEDDGEEDGNSEQEVVVPEETQNQQSQAWEDQTEDK